MPARSAKKQSVYRIRNWKQYNDALVRRGSLTLWLDPAVIDTWRYQGPTRRGARFQYSDLAIECLLTLRAVYHLTLRATEGFAASLFELIGLDLPIPDYSTLCRRASSIGLRIPRNATGPLHLVVDSTGLKGYGEGEWKVRKHGSSKRRTWLKVHLAIDPESHEVQAVIASEPGVTDAEAVPDLLGQVRRPLASMTADGTYDRRTVYAELEQRQAGTVIPPRRDAKIWRHGNSAKL